MADTPAAPHGIPGPTSDSAVPWRQVSGDLTLTWPQQHPPHTCSVHVPKHMGACLGQHTQLGMQGLIPRSKLRQWGLNQWVDWACFRLSYGQSSLWLEAPADSGIMAYTSVLQDHCVSLSFCSVLPSCPSFLLPGVSSQGANRQPGPQLGSCMPRTQLRHHLSPAPRGPREAWYGVDPPISICRMN